MYVEKGKFINKELILYDSKSYLTIDNKTLDVIRYHNDDYFSPYKIAMRLKKNNTTYRGNDEKTKLFSILVDKLEGENREEFFQEMKLFIKSK